MMGWDDFLRDLPTWFRKQFYEIMKKYGLKLFVKNRQEIALVGRDYAISFFIFFKQVDCYFYDRDEDGQLVSYLLGHFLATKPSSDEDRKGLVPSSTVEESVINQLIVYSRELERNWPNILRGERDWIADYRVFPLGGKPDVIRPAQEDGLGQFI